VQICWLNHLEISERLSVQAAPLREHFPRFLVLSISTAFVESTFNRVVSRRFAKKQQMQWSKVGAPSSCRPEPKLSTARCAIYSPSGIRARPSTKIKSRPSPGQPDHLPYSAMLPPATTLVV
jgi:hypothetical protein